MPACQFSEDEYEDFLLDELRHRYGRGTPHFKPTRPRETHLGYDFAVHTSFERLLGPGLFLVDDDVRRAVPTDQWGALPPRYVSAFVQCKTPYRIEHPGKSVRAAQQHWNGLPYYRIELSMSRTRADPHGTRQVEALRRLERTTHGRAIVRYAAPCFWTFSSCAYHVYSESVAAHSHFQSPSRLAGHEHYTYRHPHEPGLALSEPENVEASTLEESIRERLAAVSPHSLAEHLIWLSETLIEDDLLDAPSSLDVEAGQTLAPEFPRGLPGLSVDESPDLVGALIAGMSLRRQLSERGLCWLFIRG